MSRLLEASVTPSCLHGVLAACSACMSLPRHV
jgi:hypothetical protein